MLTGLKTENAILQEIEWFTEVLNTRLKLFFNQPSAYANLTDIAVPELHTTSPYGETIQKFQLHWQDRLLVILSLVPMLQPSLLDVLHLRNNETDARFTEFGAIKGTQHQGLIPTLETLLFILAGDNLEERIRYINYFSANHILFRENCILLENPSSHEPRNAGILSPSPEFLEMLVSGTRHAPQYSSKFPAQHIETAQNWDDLVLSEDILKQIEEITTWIEFKEILYSEELLGDKIKRGQRCLFYGPPGTGKTLTATLLGKHTGLDVYRIDLSLVVSKYIGETEKNLSRIFDQAENRNWILFFDEADALFGKRTNVKDSHDRYANQEVSFLLQRIEDFNDIVILATNFKSNIDDAFARRFQNVIQFPVPDKAQRILIWEKALPKGLELDAKVNLEEIAENFELTGGSIVNVVRYCALMAIKRKDRRVEHTDIITGIRREYQKEGKTS